MDKKVEMIMIDMIYVVESNCYGHTRRAFLHGLDAQVTLSEHIFRASTRVYDWNEICASSKNCWLCDQSSQIKDMMEI